MTRLTAKAARDKSQAKDPAFAIDSILQGVAKQAEQGRYEYTTRDYGFGTDTYCNEDKYPELCKSILKELRDLGFRCAVQVKEGQFVDLYLSVRWDEVTK